MRHKIPALIMLSVFALGVASGTTIQIFHYSKATVKGNVTITILRNGIPIYFYEGHNFVTNIGLDFCEQQLGSSPSTESARWISLSTSSQAPLQTWTKIPDELATSGLSRTAGTYSSLGIGQWKIEKTFTATALVTGIQLSGLHWASTGDNNLFAVLQMPSANVQANDNLLIQWQVTVARAT